MTCSEITKNAASTLKNWFSNSENRDLKSRFLHVDIFLLAITGALVVFGLIMVYSSSYIFAEERAGNGFHFIKKQLVFALIGISLMIWATGVRADFWMKNAGKVLFGTLA